MVLREMHEVDQKYPGKIKWINPHDIYCDGGACDVMNNGHILYRDSNHPSAFSANILLSPVAEEMKTQN